MYEEKLKKEGEIGTAALTSDLPPACLGPAPGTGSHALPCGSRYCSSTKKDQTLAELQNNTMLVKLDLQKKAACISEQYHTVVKLQGQSSAKKHLGANQENQQPN
ncbi:Kinesin-like protein KIF20A [Fukomys damarensis]|uniref:Kinesin-like protein KIF20A n=1 Tax=Fukomys damarensis TaxID=885580 RepID=A0A091DUC6_FUKDA|nr:Kinesin-like protein KIF20A [Fukomys damarensis]